jgi:hypothetical protein
MDALLVLVIVVAAFGAGFVLGELSQAHKFIQKISTDPDNMINMLNKLKVELARLKELEATGAPLDSIEVKLEQQGAMYYCYRAETNEFLGQNTDRDELLKAVSQKLNNANILAKQAKEINQTA